MVDHHLKYRDSSGETGQVKSGWVKIPCPLEEVWLEKPSPDSEVSVMFVGTLPAEHECCLGKERNAPWSEAFYFLPLVVASEEMPPQLHEQIYDTLL